MAKYYIFIHFPFLCSWIKHQHVDGLHQPSSTCLGLETFGKGTHRFKFPWGNMINHHTWSSPYIETDLPEISCTQTGQNWGFQQEITWNFVTLIWHEEATHDFTLYPYLVECSLGLLTGCPTVTPMSSPPFCSKQLPFCRAIWTVFGLGQLRHVHWVGWPNTKFRHTSTMTPW